MANPTSSQESPQPQASGTAAIRASVGTRTKAYTSAASEDGRLSAITGLAPLNSPPALEVDAGVVLVVVTLGGLSSVWDARSRDRAMWSTEVQGGVDRTCRGGSATRLPRGTTPAGGLTPTAPGSSPSPAGCARSTAQVSR